MKRITTIIALMILGSQLTAQYRIDDGSELLTLQKVPMEKMYVHLSSTLLFSGEYLYYKAYCMDARTGRLNPASSVAYVSLINASGDEIFNHKLNLNQGMAQGDFFVNTDIPSGTYKLMGYTRWMQNGGLEQLFTQDIAILNPYRSDQSVLLGSGSDSTAVLPSAGAQTPESTLTQGGLIELLPDASLYETRSPVLLDVRNFKGRLGHGSYSLLVRKIPELPEPQGMGAEDFSRQYQSVSQVLPKDIGDSIYLPEQRGELIFGRVLNADTGEPVPDREIILSIPGEDFILTSARSDTDGYFFSYLRKAYEQRQLFFQVTDDGNYRVLPGRVRQVPMDELSLTPYRIESTYEEAILSRSTYNQLENAYFEKKPDTLASQEMADPFEGGVPEVIELDDYTRFPTFQETLIEILNFVGYRNAPDDKDYIRVAQDFETYDEPYNDDPALLLIDGVFIPDPENYKTFNARRIKTIRVLRDPLSMGSKTYQGIVAVETFEKDFAEGYSFKNGFEEEIRLPEPLKRYFRQDHSDGQYDRIPDFRQVLFWEPMLNIESPSNTFSFYTSDLPGTYEIVLEGFTTYGKPISLRKRFEVR